MIEAMYVSSVSELLHAMLIPEQSKLEELEAEFPGAIRMGPTGRYGCRLLALNTLYEFVLLEKDGAEYFQAMVNGVPLREPRSPAEERLFRLVRHRAAEAMNGVRAGHNEYNIRRHKLRRKKGVKERV